MPSPFLLILFFTILQGNIFSVTARMDTLKLFNEICGMWKTGSLYFVLDKSMLTDILLGTSVTDSLEKCKKKFLLWFSEQPYNGSQVVPQSVEIIVPDSDTMDFVRYQAKSGLFNKGTWLIPEEAMSEECIKHIKLNLSLIHI